MSVQISFIHSERDAIDLSEELIRYNCIMLKENGNVCDNIAKTLYDDMQTEGHMFWLARPKETILDVSLPIWIGHMIELKNCVKGNPDSRTYYDGRLYLPKTRDGNYNCEIKDIFEEIRKYIKRNYYYSKHHIYLGPDFLENYYRKRFFAVYGGITPIIF